MSPTRLAAASLAAFLITSPALAQAQTACGAPPPPQVQPRKPSALGGLLTAAREAGLGEAIAGGMGGSGRNSTAAAVVGAGVLAYVLYRKKRERELQQPIDGQSQRLPRGNGNAATRARATRTRRPSTTA